MNAKAWLTIVGSALLLACTSANPSGGGSGSGGLGPSDNTNQTSSGSGATGSSSGDGNNSPTNSGSGGNSSPSSSSGSSSSSGGGGTGGSSSGSAVGSAGPKDAADIPDSDVGQTFTFTTNAYTVAAGAEVFMCQAFANPFGGDADLIWMQGRMTQGSHHFFLFNINSTEALLYSKTLAPCPMGGLEIHPFAFLSQQPLWTTQFPTASDGSPMGYRVPATNSVMLNVHFLNASSKAVQAVASITVEVAKSGVVKTHVGTLFLEQTNMTVPTNATVQNPAVASKTWAGNPSAASADGSYEIFTSWTHMHKWGLELTASTNNEQFYSETNWNSPSLFWHLPGYTNPATATGNSTPIQMKSSQSLTWACKDFNNTGSTLTFGESAATNVMCVYIGQYFPANTTTPDIIASL